MAAQHKEELEAQREELEHYKATCQGARGELHAVKKERTVLLKVIHHQLTTMSDFASVNRERAPASAEGLDAEGLRLGSGDLETEGLSEACVRAFQNFLGAMARRGWRRTRVLDSFGTQMMRRSSRRVVSALL